MRVLILALLCLSVLCDNQVVINCYQCTDVNACETYSGGGFNGGSYMTSASSCA